MRQQCLQLWQTQAKNRVIPISYLDCRPAPSSELAPHTLSLLPWSGLLQQRSLCRLRAGLLRLGHVLHAKSSARRQSCIYCDTPCGSLTFHVLAHCEVWSDHRNACWEQVGRAPPSGCAAQIHALFSLRPGGSGFSELLAWAAELDAEAKKFWGCDMQA